MNHHTNKVRIGAVANLLGALRDKVVFVGGATISLYAEKPVGEIRPTDDVDVIVEILNYAERIKVEEQLRAIGFKDVADSNVVCRFQIDGIIVDIMPTNDPSIGFENIWYPDGFKQAVDYSIDERCTVKILSAPYFIATKMEAFKSRGKGNGRTSHDFEDIIFVLESRKSIWDEMKNADRPVKEYLVAEFQKLLQSPHIIEWIGCHVEKVSYPSTYFIIEELKKIVDAN
jgi:predicted nucleotidyltransferase